MTLNHAADGAGSRSASLGLWVEHCGSSTMGEHCGEHWIVSGNTRYRRKA